MDLTGVKYEIRDIKAIFSQISLYSKYIEDSGCSYQLISNQLFDDSKSVINIFHYSGHSNKKAIQLSSSPGSDEVTVEKFAEMLNGKEGIEIAFLNSCCSEVIGEKILGHNIKAVIETTKKVSDFTAWIFAKKFYKLLAAGKDLKFAFEETCRYIEQGGHRDLLPESDQERFLEGAEIDISSPGQKWKLSYKDERFVKGWRLIPEARLTLSFADPKKLKLLIVFDKNKGYLQDYYTYLSQFLKLSSIMTPLVKEHLKKEEAAFEIQSLDEITPGGGFDISAIKSEAKAADIILFLANSVLLFDFLQKQNLEFLLGFQGNKSQKTVVAVIDGKKEFLGERFNELMPHYIPKYDHLNFKKLSELEGCAKAIKEIFLHEFFTILGQFEALKGAVQQIDLAKPTGDFVSHYQASNKFNLVLIEGKPNSGHFILLKNNLEYLKEEWKQGLPELVKFSFSEKKIKSKEDFWTAFALDVICKKELIKPGEISEALISRLNEEPVIVLINDLFDEDQDIDNLNKVAGIFSEFLEELAGYLNEKTVNHHFYIFGINKGFDLDNEYHFQSVVDASIPPFCSVSLRISDVEAGDFTIWKTQEGKTFKKLFQESLYPEVAPFPGKLEHILINLGPYFNLSSKEIQQIINLA